MISSLPGNEQIEISKGSQSVVESIGDSVEWDRSYLTDEGTFCVYRTDDEQNINKHAQLAGFPADKITAVDHRTYQYDFTN